MPGGTVNLVTCFLAVTEGRRWPEDKLTRHWAVIDTWKYGSACLSAGTAVAHARRATRQRGFITIIRRATLLKVAASDAQSRNSSRTRSKSNANIRERSQRSTHRR